MVLPPPPSPAVIYAGYRIRDKPVGAHSELARCRIHDAGERVWNGSQVQVVVVVMSNQRFLKIESFRFPTFVPKKIEYIRFLN
jgi:hypothetical protein